MSSGKSTGHLLERGYVTRLNTNEKELLCALLECFCHSMPDISTGTTNLLPVPHLALDKLNQIGVHFLALERTGDKLTDSLMEILQADMTCANLQGIPTAFTAYVQCDTCAPPLTPKKTWIVKHAPQSVWKQSPVTDVA